MNEKRKKYLVAPLEKEELHIFNVTSSLEKSIQEILDIINNKAYGIYLIGGMRGSGKTSTMNLCTTKYWKTDLIRITLNCNRMIGIESFIYFFIEELYEKTKGLILPDEILGGINDIRIKVQNNVLNKQIDKNDIFNKESSKVDKSNEIGQTFKKSIINNWLEFMKKIVYIESKSSIDEISNSINTTKEVQEKNDNFILINRITEILVKIAEPKEEGNSKYNVVVIIDEIDKQSKKFIEDLLDFYKNLFLNSHIITFLVVDLLNYLEINHGSELDNKLLSYFVKSIYIPTISDKDLKDYLYREFNINNYREYIIINYLTCGVLRKINTYKYLEGYNDFDLFMKAYIYYLVLSESVLSSNKLYIEDLYKIFLKEIIEELFYQGSIQTSYIKEYIKKREEKYLYKYDLNKVIVRSLAQICKDNEYIKYILLPDGEIRYFLNIKKGAECKLLYEYSHKNIEYKLEKHQFYKINRYFYKETTRYIQIPNDKSRDFRYIIRLIETLYERVENVYIIKKIGEFYGSEGYSYSVVLEIDRMIGRVMYVMENFSEEDSSKIREVEEFFKENKIRCIYIETDYEPIKGNVDYIRNILCEKIEGET